MKSLKLYPPPTPAQSPSSWLTTLLFFSWLGFNDLYKNGPSEVVRLAQILELILFPLSISSLFRVCIVYICCLLCLFVVVCTLCFCCLYRLLMLSASSFSVGCMLSFWCLYHLLLLSASSLSVVCIIIFCCLYRLLMLSALSLSIVCIVPFCILYSLCCLHQRKRWAMVGRGQMRQWRLTLVVFGALPMMTIVLGTDVGGRAMVCGSGMPDN